jgi:hypothetical protein
MTKAKRPRSRPAGLDRRELAAALGVSTRKVDRLVAAGLEPVGQRGAAKLYDPAAARRLAAKLVPAEHTALDVLLADYTSHAEDLHDRRRELLATWVSERDFRPTWRQFVASVERLTAPWPGIIAERVAAVKTAREAVFLAAADRAWVEPAQPSAELLKSMNLTPDEWQAQQPKRPPPVMRPLLQSLSDAIETAPARRGDQRKMPEFRHFLSGRALARVLSPPAPNPLPPAPRAVDEARARWREARAAHRRIRVAVRRGHLRRDAVRAAITAALTESRARWWRWARIAHEARADHAKALEAAERLRSEALTPLALDEILPAPAADESTTSPTSRGTNPDWRHRRSGSPRATPRRRRATTSRRKGGDT